MCPKEGGCERAGDDEENDERKEARDSRVAEVAAGERRGWRKMSMMKSDRERDLSGPQEPEQLMKRKNGYTSSLLETCAKLIIVRRRDAIEQIEKTPKSPKKRNVFLDT